MALDSLNARGIAIYPLSKDTKSLFSSIWLTSFRFNWHRWMRVVNRLRRRHIRGFTLGLRRIKLTEYVYSKSVNYWTYTLDASIRPAYSSDHWGCVEFRRNYNPIKIYIIRQLNQWRQINHSFSHINLIKHMHSIVTIPDNLNVLRNF